MVVPSPRWLPWIGWWIAAATAGCGGSGATATEPEPAPRTWRMGFAPTPPVLTTESVLQGIDLWSPRAELVVFHEELPWTDLLGGMTAQQILERDKTQLVAHLRARGLDLVFVLDLTDGLSRADEAPQLRTLGRSLAEPAVQQVARDYAVAVSTLLAPEFLGLAAETNLIRLAAPPSLYAAVVTTAQAIEQDLATIASPSTRFISVQVETAWGLLQGGPYVGIAQDLADFPYVQALGLSSYPYFVFDEPSAIPADYYTRLLGDTTLPAFVAEGGWSSLSVGTTTSTPARQAAYFDRHAELLDSIDALAWLQLLFADPDLTQWPQPLPSNLPLFTSLGVTDPAFAPKPALAAWDRQFARPWRP